MRKLLVLFICLLPLMAIGQNVQPNTDYLYSNARSLANKNQYDKAKESVQQILSTKPNHYDARVLLGRIYAWQHQYDSARVELRKVLTDVPSHHDVIEAILDVEFWDTKYYDALTHANQGLYYYPNDFNFLLKKVKILLAMGRVDEAREVLAILHKLYPNNPEVRRLFADLNQYKNRIALEHTADFYYTPNKYQWHMNSLQYQRDAKWGSFIGKVNMGKAMTDGNISFKNPDFQVEADAYPIISSNVYLYLNYGYSWGEFFPRHRAGFEPFVVLPHNWEVSAGGRLLIYDFGGTTTNVSILTASVSKYVKSNWFSFRPYYVFINKSFSQSYLFYYRYYYTNYNYLGGVIGIGNSPDDPSIRSGDVSRLSIDSYMARVDFQHLLGKRFLFRSFTGVSLEKYTADKFRPRFDATLYIAFLF